jgi:hypothetical protein
MHLLDSLAIRVFNLNHLNELRGDKPHLGDAMYHFRFRPLDFAPTSFLVSALLLEGMTASLSDLVSVIAGANLKRPGSGLMRPLVRKWYQRATR